MRAMPLARLLNNKALLDVVTGDSNAAAAATAALNNPAATTTMVTVDVMAPAS